MSDYLDISEEKRRELARGYADELVQAVDWLIAEFQKQTSSQMGSSVHSQPRRRGGGHKAARRSTHKL